MTDAPAPSPQPRLSDDELKELERLLKEASIGRVHADLDPRTDGAHQVCEDATGYTVAFMAIGCDEDTALARVHLIAAAVNAAPLAVAELRGLRQGQGAAAASADLRKRLGAKGSGEADAPTMEHLAEALYEAYRQNAPDRVPDIPTWGKASPGCKHANRAVAAKAIELLRPPVQPPAAPALAKVLHDEVKDYPCMMANPTLWEGWRVACRSIAHRLLTHPALQQAPAPAPQSQQTPLPQPVADLLVKAKRCKPLERAAFVATYAETFLQLLEDYAALRQPPQQPALPAPPSQPPKLTEDEQELMEQVRLEWTAPTAVHEFVRELAAIVTRVTAAAAATGDAAPAHSPAQAGEEKA